MKKIIGITVLVLMLSLTMNAQSKKGGMQKGSDMTTEQKATLQAKKMALRLDLDANQQKDIEKFFLKSNQEFENDRAAFREKRQSGELTADEKFAFENSRLERQKAHKTEMKKVLNKEQYTKWEETMMGRSKNARSESFKRNKSKNNGGQNRMNQNSDTQKQFKNRG